jgi:MYXO-CTERM domain-containing protein
VSGSGLGGNCTAGTDCESTICGEPHAGEPAVCTATCNALTLCPSGFDCNGGYCFIPASDADSAGGGTQDGYSVPKGCAVSSTGGGFDWSSAGWLSLGLVVVARRRRTARR